MAAAYIIAMRRGTIGPADDVTPWFRHQRWRPVFFFTGLLITFIALESPIDYAGDYYLFSMHMVQHMLLMMVAPPLMIVAASSLRGRMPSTVVSGLRPVASESRGVRG